MLGVAQGPQMGEDCRCAVDRWLRTDVVAAVVKGPKICYQPRKALQARLPTSEQASIRFKRLTVPVSDHSSISHTDNSSRIGSHIVVTLLLSRKYVPVVVDNFHNSKPKAIQACEEIAREALG